MNRGPQRVRSERGPHPGADGRYPRQLDLEKFKPREYAALNWVHHLLTCPGGVPPRVEEVFAFTFTPKAGLIKASMKSMFSSTS